MRRRLWICRSCGLGISASPQEVAAGTTLEEPGNCGCWAGGGPTDYEIVPVPGEGETIVAREDLDELIEHGYRGISVGDLDADELARLARLRGFSDDGGDA